MNDEHLEEVPELLGYLKAEKHTYLNAFLRSEMIIIYLIYLLKEIYLGICRAQI